MQSTSLEVLKKHREVALRDVVSGCDGLVVQLGDLKDLFQL